MRKSDTKTKTKSRECQIAEMVNSYPIIQSISSQLYNCNKNWTDTALKYGTHKPETAKQKKNGLSII